jgi:hypothetical protein
MSVRRTLAVLASATALGAIAPALLTAAPAAAATTACVTGKARYLDKDGNAHPAARLRVQAWDDDTSPNDDDLLRTGQTRADGSYTLCFGNEDAHLGQDLYLKFITENNDWRVQTPGGQVYVTTVDGPDNVADGSTTSLGTTQPTSSEMRSWHAYDELNDAWNFVPDHGPAGCWDAFDASCRKLVVEWAPDSTKTTGYYPDADEVRLDAEHPDFPDVVVHEVGHAIMDDVYEDNANYRNTYCVPHPWEVVLSQACAWDEGFADWFALAVNGDPFFTGPASDGTVMSRDIDKLHWNTAGFADGDAVEGRVAGALLDISDSAKAAGSDTWDRTAEGAGKIWTTFLRSGDPEHFEFRQPIRSFGQFWNYRAWDQFDRSMRGALASVYQNAIDYGYREPLDDYTPLTRPVPIPDHYYTFSTNTAYWSVVALDPDADYDLHLYDDTTGESLNYGPQSGSKTEFIAIDSNAGRRPVFGNYKARVVNRASGAELTQLPYAIELAQGAQTLGVGTSQTISMQSNDVVAVRDVRLEAGQTVTITATPNNNLQIPEMFLMASDPSNPNSWVPSRGTAAKTATRGDNGGVTLTYTAPRTAYYGLVLLQDRNSPTGSYTVTAS